MKERFPRVWLIPLLLAACASALQDSQEIPRVKLVLTADKVGYARLEPITFTLRVVNGTPSPVRLSFQTGQRFDLVMRDAKDQEIWRWSAGRLFTQMLGEETIPPSGGELRFEATARGDFNSGVYTVTGLIQSLEGTLSARTAITVR